MHRSLSLARKTAIAEIRPIDDIRSTARYRAAVAGNLVAEFLESLEFERTEAKNESDVLARWNDSPIEAASRTRFCLVAVRKLGPGDGGSKTVCMT